MIYRWFKKTSWNKVVCITITMEEKKNRSLHIREKNQRNWLRGEYWQKIFQINKWMNIIQPVSFVYYHVFTVWEQQMLYAYEFGRNLTGKLFIKMLFNLCKIYNQPVCTDASKYESCVWEFRCSVLDTQPSTHHPPHPPTPNYL